MRIPTESEEQQSLMRYVRAELCRYPELNMLFHVPNEGERRISTGGRMKNEGLRRGVPDLFLDVARCGYHGLRIELKRIRYSRRLPEQKEWILRLNSYGYAAAFCYGWTEAWELIHAYLTGEDKVIKSYISRSVKEAKAG